MAGNDVKISIIAQAEDAATAELKKVEARMRSLNKQLRIAEKEAEKSGSSFERFIKRAERLDRIRNQIMMVEGLGQSFAAVVPALVELGKMMDGFHDALERHKKTVEEYGDAVKDLQGDLEKLSVESLRSARVSIFAQLAQIQPEIDALRANVNDPAARALDGVVTEYERQLNRLEGLAGPLREALARLDAEVAKRSTPGAIANAIQKGLLGDFSDLKPDKPPGRNPGVPVGRSGRAGGPRDLAAIEAPTLPGGLFAEGISTRMGEAQSMAERLAEQHQMLFGEEIQSEINAMADAYADAITGTMVPALGEWGSALEHVASAMVAAGMGADSTGKSAVAAAGAVASAAASMIKDRAAYAAVEAAIQTGLGIAMSFINPAEAASHFAAAAALGLAAAMGGAAGGGQRGGGGQRPANDNRGRGSAGSNSNGGDRVVVYNISAGVADGQGIVRTIRQSERAAMGTGADRRRGW